MAELTPEQQATLDRWRDQLKSRLEDNTYLPNPDDAHSFYQYVGGIPVRHQCPILSGNLNIQQVWNPEINTCDFPENVSVDVNPAPRKDES